MLLALTIAPLRFTAYATSPTGWLTQNRGLVEELRLGKYANVIANLDNVQYVEGLGRIVRNAGQLAVEVRSGHEDPIPFQILVLRYVSEVPAICWRFAYIIDLPA
jgi:hypothetical protein